MSDLIGRLRRFFVKQQPPIYETDIPVEWLDRAQRAFDSSELPRREVEQSRTVEQAGAVDLVALRQALLNHADPDQLQQLAVAAGIKVTLQAGGKGRQVMSLVTAAHEQGRLAALLTQCRAQIPSAPWPAANDDQ